MKRCRLAIMGIAVVLASCAGPDRGDHDQSAKIRWPVNVVPWENVMGRIGSAEVVILCLVDSYDPSMPTVQSGKDQAGPQWFASQGRSARDKTPSDMLNSYLFGVRSLDRQDGQTSAREMEPTKMAIFIVESQEQTRNRANALFTQLGIRSYDGSIPVIYVFHNKQLVTTYTYKRNPGPNGSELRALVGDLLRLK